MRTATPAATPSEPVAVTAPQPPTARPAAARAEELLHSYEQQIYRQTDRLFAPLMLVQWITGIVFSLCISPRVWAGSESRTHVHVWAALLLGGAISVPPALLALLRPGSTSTRHGIAVAQMLMSALLIHLTGGRIETHFHVFGSLAFIAFYRDWRVLIPATVVVALDHLLRGIYWPESVYGVFVASEWRWVEHAAWVAFEDVFLVIACVRGARELRERAAVTAGLDESVDRLRASQQEVEAANRARSEFVANVSHELRTPLNAIILYSELLQEGAVEDAREADVADLTKIQTASRHLLGLINGILDLSKIEAGHMELDLQTFDVRKMVDEMISTIDAVVRKNGNTLAVTLAEDLGSIHGDLTKTRQILFNLLSNAAKFTHDGSVRLAVARRGVAGTDCVEFVVTDTGIGLTDEQRAKLFRPFVQADASIARKYGGTGLGLAIVARFCALMNGEVKVESPPEGGARFIVRLPVESRAPVEPVDAAAS
jgi:signal transduction histidine kinase